MIDRKIEANSCNRRAADRLRAIEFGGSWRADPRLRFYGAVYVYEID